MRIKTKPLQLPSPVRVWITQAFDIIDAARQATFGSCSHELRTQKRERERQIDLTHRATLSFCKLLSVDD